MRPLPIRWKIAAWTVALVGLAVLIFSAVALANLYREQIEVVDAEILTSAKHLAPAVSLPTTYEILGEMVRDQPLAVFALFDKSGQPLRFSGRLPLELAKKSLAVHGLHTVKSSSGIWRLGAFHHDGYDIILGISLDEVEETFGDVIFAFSLALPAMLLVAAAGGWWIAGRLLAPVRNLTVAAERIDSNRLDQRVPVTEPNDELARLATVFNAMLVRLEDGFGQTKRFAADASHELRTPLTVMRGEIEQLLREPGILRNHEEKLLSLQEEIDRLDRITESLLLLARMDTGHEVLARSKVNLSSLIAETCEDVELLGANHQVGVAVNSGEDIWVTGDSAHLKRIVLNLLDNATKFNVPGGRADCVLTQQDGQAILRVGNTGPGIPAELRPRVFERFFRGDASRTGRPAGHGLGLSLAREIARAHGGDLLLAPPAEPGWTEFVLTLPLCRLAPGQSSEACAPVQRS